MIVSCSTSHVAAGLCSTPHQKVLIWKRQPMQRLTCPWCVLVKPSLLDGRQGRPRLLSCPALTPVTELAELVHRLPLRGMMTRDWCDGAADPRTGCTAREMRPRFHASSSSSSTRLLERETDHTQTEGQRRSCSSDTQYHLLTHRRQSVHTTTTTLSCAQPWRVNLPSGVRRLLRFRRLAFSALSRLLCSTKPRPRIALYRYSISPMQ